MIATLHPGPAGRRWRTLSAGVLAAILLGAGGCNRAPKEAAPKAPVIHAVVETDQGTFEIELLPGDAPKTVENFRLLAERGYYNGLTFHRIVKDFMIQGGDPLGTGEGGESAWGGTFADEMGRESPIYDHGTGYKRGIVAMANRGPNTNGSQFFILQRDRILPPSYTIFGRVSQGMEVIDTLAETPTRDGPDGMKSDPLKKPVITKVTIRP